MENGKINLEAVSMALDIWYNASVTLAMAEMAAKSNPTRPNIESARAAKVSEVSAKAAWYAELDAEFEAVSRAADG